jgi:hypothetical protein
MATLSAGGGARNFRLRRPQFPFLDAHDPALTIQPDAEPAGVAMVPPRFGF